MEVLIKDHGIGILDEDRQFLFKPYSVIQNQRSQEMNPHGVGLGLYISKMICEQAKGSLELLSDAETGSTFLYSMRMVREPQVEADYEADGEFSFT